MSRIANPTRPAFPPAPHSLAWKRKASPASPSSLRRSVASSPRPPRYAPLAEVGPTEHSQKFPRLATGDETRFYQCPTCEKSFTAQAVVKEDPSWSPDHKQHVRLVTLYCDHCNHLVESLVATNASGTLHGQTILQGIVRDNGQQKPVERFLADHPEAAGVLMA